jgi:hypothetical protein
MNTEGLVWLLVPFLVVVVYFILVSARPSARILRLGKRSSYAVAIVVIALVTVYTVWNFLYR